MKCIKCGMDLPNAGTYCPSCGTMNEREVTAAPSKPKMKPITFAIAVLAAVGLVAVVMAVVLAQKGSRDITSAPGGIPPPPGNITSAPPGQPTGGDITSAPPGTPTPGNTTP